MSAKIADCLFFRNIKIQFFPNIVVLFLLMIIIPGGSIFPPPCTPTRDSKTDCSDNSDPPSDTTTQPYNSSGEDLGAPTTRSTMVHTNSNIITTPFLLQLTTAVYEVWEMSFKITGEYKPQLADYNSTEHSELTNKLYEPITKACIQVLGQSFIRVRKPLMFSEGSILVAAIIELSQQSSQITNQTAWETSLSSTLSGRFINNSTSINRVDIFTTSPPPTLNLPVVLGSVFGAFAVLLVLAGAVIFLICRKKNKRIKDEERSRVNRGRSISQLSTTLPGAKKSLAWRESSGTTSISEFSGSQIVHKEQDENGMGVSLHRSDVERLSFGGEFFTSTTEDDKAYKILYNTHGLPRIMILQDEFGTMTTSTDKSLKIVVTNSNKSTSKQYQTAAKPADFGGLFVPESMSDVGKASSFGLKLNRLNSSKHKNEELQDVDLNSLSNAGELYSIKAFNSDQNINNPVRVPLPPSIKKFIHSNNDLKLHRSTSTNKNN